MPMPTKIDATQTEILEHLKREVETRMAGASFATGDEVRLVDREATPLPAEAFAGDVGVVMWSTGDVTTVLVLHAAGTEMPISVPTTALDHFHSRRKK